MKFFINLILTIISISVNFADAELLGPELVSEKQEWNQMKDYLRENELSQDVEYVRLRRKLNELISDDHDHYAEQYEYSDGRTRYPVLREKDGNFLLVDNLKFHVSHKTGKTSWSSALVDLSKLKSAMMVKNRFLIRAGELDVMLGHVQILYQFEPGGVLTRFGQVGGLYVSFDIHFKEGQTYDPIVKGLTNQYQTILQMGTQRQLFLDKLDSAGLELVHLNLDSNEVRDLFEISLEHAFRKKELIQRPYNTLHNSCITYQFDLISELLGKRIHTFHPDLIVEELSKHRLVEKVEQVEAPGGIRQYISRYFEQDADLEREPIDMVMRAGKGRRDQPIKPLIAINF